MATDSLIYLAVGGNIVPRKKTIVDGLTAIKNTFPSRFCVSALYLTDPFMQASQPAYYNCCVGFTSGSSPQDLLSFCQSLEAELGRVRNGRKWQSRTIDIDILLMGDQGVDEPGLMVPHYDLANRDFFLIPLLELDNQLIHPLTGISLKRYLEKIPRNKRTHPQKLLTPHI